MKKIVATLILSLGISLIANEKIVKPTVKQYYNISTIDEENTKILVDCSYKKLSDLSDKIYSEKSLVNNFMSKICGDTSSNQKLEITFKQIRNAMSETAKDEDCDARISIEPEKDFIHLIDKTINLEVEILFIAKHIFKPTTYEDSKFPIVSLQDLTINTTLSYDSQKTEITNILKNYKYDYLNNKIDTLVFDNTPIKSNPSKIYTNTYNIDEVTECINGSVWVKKYGAKSGDKCGWIEK